MGGLHPMIVEIGWPDRRLSPNSRAHWRVRQAPKKALRQEAHWATLAADGYDEVVEAYRGNDKPIPILFTFCPPDRRPRDMDNIIASLKAGCDGLADAIQCDDRRFVPTFKWGEVVKPGKVVIEL